MIDVLWTAFAAGAVFLALMLNGFIVEWIASYFVTEEAAQFGGFCFVLGGLLLGSKSIFTSADSAMDVGVIIGAVAGLIFLGVRVFRPGFGRKISS